MSDCPKGAPKRETQAHFWRGKRPGGKNCKTKIHFRGVGQKKHIPRSFTSRGGQHLSKKAGWHQKLHRGEHGRKLRTRIASRGDKTELPTGEKGAPCAP